MERSISDEMIEYIGILAQLELSLVEKEQAKKDMEEMLTYFNKLAEVNTEDVEPMSHVFDISNCFREDIVIDSNESENMKKNAPMYKNGMFQVPKTI